MATVGEDLSGAMPTMDDAYEVIAHEIALVAEDKRPAGMPIVPNDGARWMVNRVLEPHQREEAPRRVNTRGGQVWVWDYLTRIKVQARKFLHLSEIEQRYIIRAREDGVSWRGDDFDFFQRVYDETIKMRRDPKTYRREATALMIDFDTLPEAK